MTIPSTRELSADDYEVMTNLHAHNRCALFGRASRHDADGPRSAKVGPPTRLHSPPEIDHLYLAYRVISEELRSLVHETRCVSVFVDNASRIHIESDINRKNEETVWITKVKGD